MSIRVYIDGRIHPQATAVVSVLDRGFLYGDSVYETIAYVGGRFVFLAEHLTRLERSAKRIYLEVPARTHIEQALRATVAATKMKDARLRVMVTRGEAAGDLDPAAAHTPRLIVIAQPLLAPTAEMQTNGVAVEVVQVSRSGPGSLDPAVKSGNYLGSVLAIAEARRRSPAAHEAILCSPSGSVAEGATSNVFYVRGGEVSTPSLDVGILDGVTRAKVLTLAREAGLPTREVAFVVPQDLRTADEVFLTSAVRGILAVTTVDGVRIGDGRAGPLTRRLLSLYQRLVNEAS
jgi:branched-chain amino acid aminotransferase